MINIAVRWAVALVLVVFFMYCSMFIAGFLGWSFSPRGPHRLLESPFALPLSVFVGALGIASARRVLHYTLLTPWLLVGALPALYFGLVETAVLGI
ncbi:hypothetical protein [Bounagaea algeriensis]